MIPYLHKKHQVNYLTRGVKKHSRSRRWGENVWASVNHYHMTTHVLKVEHSCMSVIQHQRRRPPHTPLLLLTDLKELQDTWNAGDQRGTVESRLTSHVWFFMALMAVFELGSYSIQKLCICVGHLFQTHWQVSGCFCSFGVTAKADFYL